MLVPILKKFLDDLSYWQSIENWLIRSNSIENFLANRKKWIVDWNTDIKSIFFLTKNFFNHFELSNISSATDKNISKNPENFFQKSLRVISWQIYLISILINFNMHHAPSKLKKFFGMSQEKLNLKTQFQ